ncbi:efflux RND transporter periplasmic adaptor subunit [Thiolapillus sp.]|uniref:efflux RND transporter periplasmic adaptor subunit n=3 Tax=Thiolapillus sp. TaxID=2017437 RepID=UPI0025DA51D0|nr:HlyD family secretion protein [Thiolapillus sp.]
MKKILQKKFVLPLIVLLAVALVLFRVKSKPPVAHEDLGYPVKVVDVMTVRPIPYRSHATGYGNVEPRITVRAKSEVSGKIVYIHPQLRKGASLPKDTVVLRIEPTTFEFSLEQSKAGLSGSESSLRQLETEEESTRSLLAIVRKNLSVQQKEYKRIQEIWKKKLVARSSVDAEEQKVLQLKQQVADLEGKLKTYESRKAALDAQIRQSKTQVAQTRDTLGRTEIRLPMDARIGEVLVEKGEFVAAGSVLFEALGTDAVEITAELPTRLFRPLFANQQHMQVDLNEQGKFWNLVSNMKLEARVRLVGFPEAAHWQGKLLRISESIDPRRDTVGLVVQVDKPYADVIPGERPPLLKGMFTAVSFFAPAQPMLVVPRKAVHQGRVYVARPDKRLEIRQIETLYRQGEFVVVKGGLETGENIIVSAVIPVIEGLPLKPRLASEYVRKFAAAAMGDEAAMRRIEK